MTLVIKDDKADRSQLQRPVAADLRDTNCDVTKFYPCQMLKHASKLWGREGYWENSAT
jgi:hypothetical protein